MTQPHATTEYVQRFTIAPRLEHLVMLVSFTVLSVTGLPQKFNDSPWGEWFILNFGGIEIVRQVHRFAAYAMILLSLYHIIRIGADIVLKRKPQPMMLRPKDATDLIWLVLYYLGLRKEGPRFGRFNIQEKIEYWSLVWGTWLMIVTGFMMMFPAFVTTFLPGALIPAAKAAHGGEAVLAVLAVVLWHFYHSHFSPAVFPVDKSIFNGKITLHRLKEEHPLEYEHLVGAGKGDQSASSRD